VNRLFQRIAGIVAMLAIGAFVAGYTAVAQETTPEPTGVTVNELVPGVTAEILTAAPSAVAPGQTVYTIRFVFQSEAEIFPHGHPGTTVLGVLSGSFGWTLQSGTAYVVRGAGHGATGPAEVLTEPGTDVVLEPGDAIYYESDVIHTARGAGDSEAVVLGTLILQEGAPLLMPAGMDMATPHS
jgi:quercetin dioxygenase-like cupin family protein